jgi:YVTN family beta-propeller protein
VAVVDVGTRRVLAEIAVGQAPTDVAFTPDGRTAFVSNRMDDSISVLDAAARTVSGLIVAGDEPHGLAVDREGQNLYVLNTGSDDVWVYDLPSQSRKKVLRASNGPWSAALSPAGDQLLVTNTYSHDTGFRTALASEITVLETERQRVEDRRPAEGTNLMTGVAWHPSGDFALVTMNRTKSMVPMTRLEQGWTITNGLALMGKNGRVDQVLLDEPNLGFADATDVAFTVDGKTALVTSSGTNRVAVVDVERLRRIVEGASDEQRRRVLPNHLGQAAQYITKYIATGESPRGVVVTPDGKWALVANALSDSLTVIDAGRMEAAGTIDLGGPKTITKQRRGERLFHNANVAFRRQFSCHSCHPDGHVDRITYDIEADGIGVSPVDNRTLRGILDTAPFKWEGTNPSLQRQCGARLAVFFTRGLPFSKEQLADLDYYITTIPRPENRYRKPNVKLSPAQQRGKVIFERSTTNSGQPIAPEGRCITCHPAPYYTNRQRLDVGTRQASDRQGAFDVPHLNNIYDSAPTSTTEWRRRWKRSGPSSTPTTSTG